MNSNKSKLSNWIQSGKGLWIDIVFLSSLQWAGALTFPREKNICLDLSFIVLLSTEGKL